MPSGIGLTNLHSSRRTDRLQFSVAKGLSIAFLRVFLSSLCQHHFPRLLAFFLHLRRSRVWRSQLYHGVDTRDGGRINPVAVGVVG
jgi:hypothetical protein